MIEYALLFGLGFLSAALIAFLLTPAIHQRIVRFTENRLKATMPLSPQEIRAQKDMARALFAAENAKTTHALGKEREKTLGLQFQNEKLAEEASRLLGRSRDLEALIEDMKVEAGELRSQLRREDGEFFRVSDTLKRTEESAAAKDLEIESLQKKAARLTAEIDGLNMESASQKTEIDNLKQRIQILRDEREELRHDTKLAGQRAKDAEQRLSQAEHARIRLDDRLVREMASNADKEALIERRTDEVARLKEKLKEARSVGRAAERAMRAANLRLPKKLEEDLQEMDRPDPADTPRKANTLDTGRIAEDLRNRQTALAERLIKAKNTTNDDALRDEIADIAARMVVLTAANEGTASPVREILSQSASKGAGNRITLAERARKLEPGLFERSK
ncbi:hypothetical protein ACQQ2Q_20305 [Agrobacterium sp. ES01]|uniref:hypothetical protein n=1 Tax=Agrobacterium sp. ES01 TaxID=3420714 RepID=UPI003D13047E